MKKLFVLFLGMVLAFCMGACGEKEKSTANSENTANVKDTNVSVTIDGLTYNEKDYHHYLNITINNKTNKAISGYVSSLYLDEYSLDAILSIKVDANATAKQQVKIERHWIIYYYNLCNMTEVDNVTLSLKILDKETFNDMGTITTTAKIESFKFDESKLSVLDFNADINSKVYSDDNCEVTLLTFYENHLHQPTAYFLLENKKIEDKIYFKHKTENPQSYSEIIDKLNNEKEIFAEINGKKVFCENNILGPGKEGVSQGNKAIFPVVLLSTDDVGISLKDITNFKTDFVIENQNNLNNTKYAEFSVDWIK